MASHIIEPTGTISNNGVALTVATSLEDAWESISPDTEYTTAGQYPDEAYVSLADWTKPAGAVIKEIQFNTRVRRNDADEIPQYYVTLRRADYSTLINGYSDPGYNPQGVAWANRVATSTADLTTTEINGLIIGVRGWQWFEEYPANETGRMSKAYVTIHYAPAPGTPTFVGPTSTVNDTLQPTYSWAHNNPDEYGQQNKFQLKVFTSSQGDPGGATALYDSGNVTSSSESFTPPYNLTDGNTYYAYVRTATTTNGTDSWSPWTATESGGFQVSLDEGVPTGVTPSAGATITTNNPALSANGSGAVNTRREWQIASNSGFSANVQLLDENVYRSAHSTSTTVTALGGTTLDQGTWYVRARFSTSGSDGAWSSTNQFTISHAPSASVIAPTGGTSVIYGATPYVLAWSFNDAFSGDSQSAYEIESWLDSDYAGTYETTGKVTSTAMTANLSNSNVAVGWKDQEARWRVRVWDQEDVVGSWSLEGAFYLRDASVGTITYPTGGGTVTSQAPTMTWTFSTSDNRTLVGWRLQIFLDAGLSSLLYDSGNQVGDALSHTIASPLLQVSTNYWAHLTIYDSGGLTNTDTNAFTAVYTAPTDPVFGVTTTNFESAGYTDIDWSGSTADGAIVGWRVYRRLPGAAWSLIYDGEGDTVTKTYRDYTAPSNTDFEYTVVQMATSVGDVIESAYPVYSVSALSSTTYQLLVPEQPSLNLVLDHVTGDEFADEQEMGVFNLIGRGRRVEYGTRYGQIGSLTADLRDIDGGMTARQQRLAIEAIRDAKLTAYLRNPFGDVWEVAMASASVSRVPGVGLRENSTVTIEYQEITA